MRRLYSAAIILGLLWAVIYVIPVMAQQLSCWKANEYGGSTLHCVHVTPTPTQTPEPTATTQPTPTLTQTLQATPVATTMPSVTVASIVRVPLLDAVSGDSQLDANNRAIVWGGNVSTNDNYFDARIVGANDGLRVRVQVADRFVQNGDTVTVAVNGRMFTAAWPTNTGWDIGQRCGAQECRGWDATTRLDWSQVGSKPVPGDVWPFTITVNDSDPLTDPTQAQWTGQIAWGEPVTGGMQVAQAQVVTTSLTQDATLGGSTECGAPAYPDYSSAWGAYNWNDSPYVNVQAQWDIADWPCYSKYYAAWTLPSLPPGAQVVSATLTLYQFGNPGYYVGETGDTVVQVFEVNKPWDEQSITWDNAPLPTQNTSRTTVHPLPATCEWPGYYCSPGIPYAFDVTQIVKNAQTDGRSWRSAALSTAAGQYHSGKYFWRRTTSQPPVIAIAYMGAEPAPTPTPQPTATRMPTSRLTATSTATNAPLQPTSTRTSTPTSTPTKSPLPSATGTPTSAPTTPATGKMFYISPTGNDASAGTQSAPWKTFDRVWQDVYPGDTLVLMDGTYHQQLRPNVRNGEPGKPITIKAQHDGKAIIDGGGTVNTVQLGDTWPGPIGDWYVLEGLVARNGYESVISIKGKHNVLRRVSAHDASTDANSAVITLAWTSDVLLEDVIAAGTGRKEVLIFMSENVTARRVFAKWAGWDGRIFCAAGWPAGNGINIYNSANVRVENGIAVGPVADRGIGVTANNDDVYSPGLQVLGSIAIGAGMGDNGQEYIYPVPAEQGSCAHNDPEWYPGMRGGVGVYGQGTVDAPIFRDILAADNAQMGFTSEKPYGVGVINGVLDHATLYGNGKYGVYHEVGKQGTYGGFTVTNSKIAGVQNGAGARLTNRYVDGALTNVPLWPWPMDGRAQAELGYTITGQVKPYINR